MGHGARNGIELLESTDVRKVRTKKRNRRWAVLLAAVGSLGGGGVAIAKAVEARAETVAITKLETVSSSHEKEIAEIKGSLKEQGETLDDIAYVLGLPPKHVTPEVLKRRRDFGVQPLPAAAPRREH